jgi:hypothetical protein
MEGQESVVGLQVCLASDDATQEAILTSTTVSETYRGQINNRLYPIRMNRTFGLGRIENVESMRSGYSCNRPC